MKPTYTLRILLHKQAAIRLAMILFDYGKYFTTHDPIEGFVEFRIKGEGLASMGQDIVAATVCDNLLEIKEIKVKSILEMTD